MADPPSSDAAITPLSAPDGFSLHTPLSAIRGITRRSADALLSMGIRNVGQLVAHLPFKHERVEAQSTIAQIEELGEGRLVSAVGTVANTRVVLRGRRRFEAVLTDDTGRLDLVFFNALFLRSRIHPGMTLRVQGKTRRFGRGMQLSNPAFEVLPEGSLDNPPTTSPAPATPADQPAAPTFRPVYPATELINSAQIARAIAKVLPLALPLIHDHFTADFRTPRDLPELRDAYAWMHAPADEARAAAARRRLAFDELFFLQLGVALKRAERRALSLAPALPRTDAIDRHIRQRFPFPLTDAQNRAVEQIAADLALTTPMNRLLQGDVGSGKTLVALYAMLLAAAAKKQSALMAPTELLAEQHERSISRALDGSRVRVVLLTGSLPAAERERRLAAIAEGDADLIIGTHALLTDRTRFCDLALAVIDEQHRFGVHQRAALREKTAPSSGLHAKPPVPHVLVMTATPIPRTLALTLFGDLDVSTIDQLPPGRSPIKTRLASVDRAHEVYAWLRTRLDKHEQAYIVAPTIDGYASDSPDLFNPNQPAANQPAASPPPPTAPTAPTAPTSGVRELKLRLDAGPLAGKRLALLHGQLDKPARDAAMDAFRNGAIDALVATSIIEVGVDVPNASIIIIEHADRFGLAQLHQLRGRVGRGSRPSACVLIPSAPFDQLTPDAQARLTALVSTADGFKLAEHDLSIRGFGDVVGIRQAGLPPFKVAALPDDFDLLLLAKRDADAWATASPTLDRPADLAVRRRLIKAHGPWLGLADTA